MTPKITGLRTVLMSFDADKNKPMTREEEDEQANYLAFSNNCEWRRVDSGDQNNGRSTFEFTGRKTDLLRLYLDYYELDGDDDDHIYMIHLR